MDFTAMPAHSFFEVDDISLKEIEAHVQRDYASEDFNLDALWKSSEGEHKRKKKREQATTRKECMRCCSTARTKAWKSFGT